MGLLSGMMLLNMKQSSAIRHMRLSSTWQGGWKLSWHEPCMVTASTVWSQAWAK